MILTLYSSFAQAESNPSVRISRGEFGISLRQESCAELVKYLDMMLEKMANGRLIKKKVRS